jgi:hypothetical protein
MFQRDCQRCDLVVAWAALQEAAATADREGEK